MPEGERDPGWKPSRGALALLIAVALALAGATCWAFKINPLPSHNVTDPGAFLTFALVYFFALYFAVARLRR
ncbi:MAG TPA: hypothetical protein VN513_13045 [Gemmatimonadales bacterium]|nr:hypothetical protein [Gemmatimonadales bacterium]